MSSGAKFRYHFITPGHKPRTDDRQAISERQLFAAESRIEEMVVSAGPASLWAQDLLRIARAAYIADKLSPRKRAVDRWTRQLDLVVELVQSEVWSEPIRLDMEALLATLTGDAWTLEFHDGANPNTTNGRLVDTWQAEEVALFSGGLDSTAYAADTGQRRAGPLLLISYYEQGITGRQKEIYSAVESRARRHIHRCAISQRVNQSADISTRSRGLLFIATAIYAATAHGASVVTVPENGHVAVNPPLTASRSGACSSRSVHPMTLHLINKIIASVRGQMAVVNPYAELTKGEICYKAVKAGLPHSVLWRTISCGHPPTNRPQSTNYNCGYCFPCLVRRSGLHHAVGHDRTTYDRPEFWNEPQTAEASVDPRALRTWLSNPFTTRDLIVDLPLPPGVAHNGLLPVLRRGRAELVAMLTHVVPHTSPYLEGWQPSP